jgi:protein-S-isoprenylcysteine O-methyltransferase Ste14
MMDSIRYVFGVGILIIVPLGVLYWLIIHRWAPVLRTWKPVQVCLVLVPVLATLAVLLFRLRKQILGTNLGRNWWLIGIAVALCCPITWLELQYWREINFSTLVGIPELSRQRKGTLLREGIYAAVRHPRYLSAGFGMLGNALIINYLGLDILLVATLPVGFWMLTLEEKELVGRFGNSYREYQRDVPQLIPRLRRRD